MFASLPDEVTWKQSHVDAVRRHGQVRVFWDRTPLDLFFENHPFHAGTARTRSRPLPPGTRSRCCKAPSSAPVFKAMFDRRRTGRASRRCWRPMRSTAAVLGPPTEMLGDDDPITLRFAPLAQAGSAP